MKKVQQYFVRQRANYQNWDFLIFTVMTLLSILNGQTTVFYLIYFFWWNELLRIAIDRILYKRNANAKFFDTHLGGVFSSLFMMGIYFVFIVVFFGLMASYKQEAQMYINMKTLLFQNWFFNINLLIVLIERIYLHISQKPVEINFGGFTINMVVLHISIIVGGCLMFFIIQRFPETFTPGNLWASVLIASPFLLLRMAVAKLSNDTDSKINS